MSRSIHIVMAGGGGGPPPPPPPPTQPGGARAAGACRTGCRRDTDHPGCHGVARAADRAVVHSRGVARAGDRAVTCGHGMAGTADRSARAGGPEPAKNRARRARARAGGMTSGSERAWGHSGPGRHPTARVGGPGRLVALVGEPGWPVARLSGPARRPAGPSAGRGRWCGCGRGTRPPPRRPAAPSRRRCRCGRAGPARWRTPPAGRPRVPGAGS